MNKAKLGNEYLSSLAVWKGGGDFSLEGIREVLSRLEDPQDALPTIHVAGTNGKGSVSAASAAILGAAGYRVGLNVSPHLERINERIVVDGEPVTDDFIGEFALEIRNASNRCNRTLTFHEALTALSFLSFRELGLEWVVMEVGLGGRLDASNVISRPVASVIVTIDFDHQHILGDTLGLIAREKAGIIKQGATVITGNVGVEAEKSIERVVREKGAPWVRFREGFGFEYSQKVGDSVHFWCLDLNGRPQTTTFKSSLIGAHQAHNMAVAATVGSTIGIPLDVCVKGIESVYWPGRLEEFQIDSHTILMDCAHNPAGIRAFMSFLESKEVSGIDITFGVLDTKNWEEMVDLLAPVVKRWRILSPQSERALPLHLLEEKIRRISGSEVSINNYGTDYEVWLRDILRTDADDFFALTGSMYLIGRLRSLMGVPMPKLWNKKNGVL